MSGIDADMGGDLAKGIRSEDVSACAEALASNLSAI